MVPHRQIIEFTEANDESPFGTWLKSIDVKARTKVAIAIDRLGQGNDGSVKSVGGGVCEIRIDWGPGYRVYFGFDGNALIILLAGGTKQRQDRDIAAAKAFWTEYKMSKRKG